MANEVFKRLWMCVDFRDNAVLYIEHDFGHNQVPTIEAEVNVFPIAGIFPVEMTVASCVKFQYVSGVKVVANPNPLTERQLLIRAKYFAIANILKVVYWGRSKVTKNWLQQDYVYRMKEEAAEAVLNGKTPDIIGYELLVHEASVRNQTINAIAKSIQIVAEDNRRILADTEKFRIEWTERIKACSSKDEIQQTLNTMRSESYIPVTMGFLK